jgi:hypothetical protein
MGVVVVVVAAAVVVVVEVVVEVAVEPAGLPPLPCSASHSLPPPRRQPPGPSPPAHLARPSRAQMVQHALVGDFRESDVVAPCKLLEVVLQSCRGRVDACVAPYTALALGRLASAETAKLRDALLLVVANALYYNPALALQALQQVRRAGGRWCREAALLGLRGRAGAGVLCGQGGGRRRPAASDGPGGLAGWRLAAADGSVVLPRCCPTAPSVQRGAEPLHRLVRRHL